MANEIGRATAITVFTPVRRGWTRAWLRPMFWLGTRFPELPGPIARLRKLSFIHFARWTIVERLPPDAPPGEEEPLAYDHLYFESNFNGSWSQYIDAFSAILPVGLSLIWFSSFGWTGVLPVAEFKRYIRDNEYHANHFYCAYPEATTTTILQALSLERELVAFRERARDLEPERFASEYRDFLTSVQRSL